MYILMKTLLKKGEPTTRKLKEHDIFPIYTHLFFLLELHPGFSVAHVQQSHTRWCIFPGYLALNDAVGERASLDFIQKSSKM